mgnify:CR=1 FL=1
MSMEVFEVSLQGADEKGRFVSIVRVLGKNEVEAEAMARASAALRDYAVTEVMTCRPTAETVDQPYDFPRVLGHGEREYGG